MQNIYNLKILNTIILFHKIYGWSLIVISFFSFFAITFGFSFGSLLKAYGYNGFGNFLIANYYFDTIISILFGLFHLFIARKIYDKSKYSIHLSIFSLVVTIFFLGTLFGYIFSFIILVLWLLTLKNKKVLLAILIPIFLFLGYKFYVDIAMKKDDKLIADIFYKKTYTELEEMIDNGFDVNTQGKDGTTTLFYTNDLKKAKLLLDNGANPNIEDDSGLTPIFSFMIDKEIYQKYIELLIRYGADINHQDNEGNTILHTVISWNGLGGARIFLDNNSDLTIKNNNGLTAVDLAIKMYKQYPEYKNIFTLILSKAQSNTKFISQFGSLSAIHISTPFRTLLKKGEKTKLIALAKRNKTDIDITDYVIWKWSPQNAIEIVVNDKLGHRLVILEDGNITLEAQLGSIHSNRLNFHIIGEQDGHKLPSKPNTSIK